MEASVFRRAAGWMAAAVLSVGLVAAGASAFAGRAFASDDAFRAGAAAFVQEDSGSGEATDPASADPAATDPVPEAPHADGWEQQESGAWSYWQNGAILKGAWLDTATAPGIAGIPSGSHRYWLAQDGTLATARLIDPDSAADAGAGFWAYATDKGYVATGKTVVGKKVYLAKASGKLESGNSLGFLVTKKYDGSKQRYYIDKTEHAAITGKVVKVPGWGKVYSMAKKGYLVCGVTRIDKTHVLLAEKNGKLCQKRGWTSTSKYSKDGKQRYWLERTKKDKGVLGARTGMFKAQGNKFFASKAGAVFRNGYKKIKGVYYSADGKGVLTKNNVVTRMAKLAQGYSSPSRYLIMVDTDDTKLIVFEGSQGKWKPLHVWDCSTGAPETPTVLGVYSVGLKGYSFGEDRGFSCYYWTQFYGDYLFHTRIYQANTHILNDAEMNTMVSHGCVRLYDEDAYWIWTHVPEGTTVVTMV